MKNITEKFESIEKTYEELKCFVTLDQISPFMEIATTAAAIVTQDNNVYYGVNIKGDCGLGFCAERNALSTMLTAGGTKVKYVLCIDRSLSPRLPCGACREYMPQIWMPKLSPALHHSNLSLSNLCSQTGGDMKKLKEKLKIKN